MNVTLSIILGIVLLVAALFLIIAVILQNGKSKGTGVVTGGAETFFGKSKAKSMDKKLGMLTAIVAIVFVVIVIGVYIVEQNGWFDETTVTTNTNTNSNTNSGSNTNSSSSSSTNTHDHSDPNHTH